MNNNARYFIHLKPSARDILCKGSALTLSLMMLLQGLVSPASAQVSVVGTGGESGALQSQSPQQRQIGVAPPVNVMKLAAARALGPASEEPVELKAIHPPGEPPQKDRTGGTPSSIGAVPRRKPRPQSPTPTVPSPPPSQTFKSDQLSIGFIPPDTMGAVGPNHVVTTTNEKIVFHNRTGSVLSTVTLNTFWSGIVLEGGAVPSAFDPKILYDRFNDRWIIISTANAQILSSSTLFAVSQTSDPTGTYNRYFVDADAAATAGGGRWADYPSLGFNKNWISVSINQFGFGSVAGYQGPSIYVLNKAAAYAGTLSTVSVFEDFSASCADDDLGCGFTLVPAITEDNTTDTLYLVEDWFPDVGQLRISRLEGTPAAPVLTVGYQFPQSLFSWRFNASQISGTAGYTPQRAPNAYAGSGARISGNDSRIQNVVLKGSSLWTVHHVMVAATPTIAGTPVGGAANPDIRTAIQWWEIDPTLTSDSLTGTLPIQRARIEDPLADNCHNGSGGTRTTGPCTSTNTQTGDFYTFPTIAVNQSNDVLIGYSRFSRLTLPKAGYSFRASTDAPNTMRDPMVFREGQSAYSLFDGVRVRWGDFSQTMIDPVNLTDFWTIQEYSEAPIPLFANPNPNSSPWSTWWSLVKPSSTTSYSGSLIISEFRFRGPDPDGAGTATGARDEFVELYNPGSTPVTVSVADNSEGWALAFSSNGTTVTGITVIPNGTTIPAKGHLLITNNARTNPNTSQDLGYSLRGYANTHPPGSTQRRVSDGDVSFGASSLTVELADNGGIAIFKTSNPANMTVGTVMDSVGFAAIAAGLFKEGAGIPNLTIPVGGILGQISFHRTQVSGAPQDTGNNAADFIFTNTNPSETLGSVPVLGAPGPENLDSPILNNNVFVDRFDQTVGTNTAPNRFRDLTPVTNGALGTLSFRRKVQNLTGQPVTRLRFRIKQISTLNGPIAFGTADLRALTSGLITVNSQPVEGTLVEEPATQALGGGWNTSWSLALPAPLAPNATINVQYVVGVQSGGSFSIFINVEALP